MTRARKIDVSECLEDAQLESSSQKFERTRLEGDDAAVLGGD